MTHDWEKVRLIVIFGDTEGSTTFWDSVTDSELELVPFWDMLDGIVEKAKEDTAYSFTDTGDGFMVLIDIHPPVDHQSVVTNSKTAVNVIRQMLKLLKTINTAISKKEGNRPAGFRMVGACGYALKKKKRGGETIFRGKHLHLAHNALDMARGFGFLVHDNLRNLILEQDAKKAGLYFSRPNVANTSSVLTTREALQFSVVKLKAKHNDL